MTKKQNQFPKRHSRNVIYTSDWIDLYLDKVEMPDGTFVEKYHQLHFPYESACVVVTDQSQRILMIQSKRYTTGRIEWEIPTGRVEKNETPSEAVKRECREETGCELKELNHLCCYYPNNGMSDLKMHVFVAKAMSDIAAFDENEVKSCAWLSKEQIKRMLKHNEIQCGVTILAILYAFTFYML